MEVKDRYLGKSDTDESRHDNQIIGQWFAAGPDAAALEARPQAAASADTLNIDQVIVEFWTHAQTHYRGKD